MNTEPELQEEAAEEVAILAECEDAEQECAAAPAMLVLIRQGAETDISFGVTPPAVIGRFDPTVGPIDVDLSSIEEGSYVSRKHARISLTDEGEWQIEDMGSSNGTWVMGDADFEKVELAMLDDGATISLGNARFKFRLA